MNTELAQAFYNASAVTPRNDPASPESYFSVKNIEELLKVEIRPGIRALDLGCNAGRFSFAMEQWGALSTGVDCADVPLAHARTLAEKWNSKCIFVRQDLEQLDFPENSFDFALLTLNIIEHSYDAIDNMTRRLTRILTPKGRFALQVIDQYGKAVDGRHRGVSYDPLTGRIVSQLEVPNKGSFTYETFVWTAAFVKRLIGLHMDLILSQHVEGHKYWLVFENRPKGGPDGR